MQGVVANRVAPKACLQAHDEEHDVAHEGNRIIPEASKWNPELTATCGVGKKIKFEFPAYHQNL